MFLIEPAEYAPDYLKALIADHHASAGGDGSFNAVIMAMRYQTTNVAEYPNLRDRTAEFERMLHGFAADGAVIRRTRILGHELADRFGFKPVGAQYATTYDILWV